MQLERTFKTTPGFWYLSAVLIMLLPVQWTAAIFISSMVHESFHAIAARLTGVRIRSIRLCASGVYMDTEHMSPRQQLICALAGPVGALLLLFWSAWLPRTCLCAILQSCYHLLPVYPNDGGRALRSWTNYIGIPQSEALCFAVETITLVLLFLGGAYLTLYLRLGLLPIGACLAMIFRVCREKYLANRTGKGYNISNIL